MKPARQRKSQVRPRAGRLTGPGAGRPSSPSSPESSSQPCDGVASVSLSTSGPKPTASVPAVGLVPSLSTVAPSAPRRLAPEAFDREERSGVNTPAGEGGATTPAMPASVAMEQEHFGIFLRRARERRELVLADVAQKTKVARSTLELLERGQLADLPAGVYVRGFIRSFARAVGTDETEPLLMYERAVEAKCRADKARDVTPVAELPAPLGPHADDEAMAPRRGLGLAVFVIILLLIATITLSLLLRRPPPSGEGLSLAPTPELPSAPRTPPA
jgi:transcriptional regulator with XRE-family HTH domain